jgi:hypothetical protein
LFSDVLKAKQGIKTYGDALKAKQGTKKRKAIH